MKNREEDKPKRESLFAKSKRDQAEQQKDSANIAAQNANTPKLSTTVSYKGHFKGGIMRVDKALQDAGAD
jgi:hypothetical protein